MSYPEIETINRKEEMNACPVCATPSDKAIASTPYFECPTCALWFQSPLPPKVFQAPTEYDLAGMPEGDRVVNRDLAARLFDTVMGGRSGRTLDIGAKHPVLASALAERGCAAFAIDGVMPSPEPGVICEQVDFEANAVEEGADKFRLITMIHVFEHMYDPLAALRKLRALVEDDGRVFLRLPDHRVPGIERDLTAHHFTIHPYVHCLTSLLEALAQVGDCFEIESTGHMNGFGQRDVVLRPISRAPRLAVAMIAKNEAADIGRAVGSFAPIADAFALVDTGSTDDTIGAAISEWCPPGHLTDSMSWRTYTDASERDETGEWRLWSFAQARNESLSDAEASGADWILWVDADDEILTPAAIRRAMYWPEFDVFGTWIEDGGHRWIHQRMWKASKRVRFEGRCHEYPVTHECRVGQIDEGRIRHHADPQAGQENSNPRNLRILLREWEEKPSPRTAFYLANTYRDAGRPAEAAEWYERRIEFGQGFRDEYLFSLLYCARAYRAIPDHAAADAKSQAGLAAAPDWMEFRLELAQGRYHRGQYAQAIEEAARVAPGCPISPTPLWREVSAYRDAPPRLISWCHEHLGNVAQALVWGELAALLIGGPDAEWSQRLSRLRAQWDARDNPPPPFVKRLRRQVALHRPGAIGDILMTLNLIPALRAAHPEADIHYFCQGSLTGADALGGVMAAAGVDLALDCASLPAWRKNYDRVIDLIGYPLAEGYPEKPMRRHLLSYFAEEMDLQEVAWDTGAGIALPALTLPRPRGPLDNEHDQWPYITMQTKAGWSAWKEWPQDRWATVSREVSKATGCRVELIDESRGWTLAESIAVFANSAMHLGIDSFTNHLTNYYWETERGARRVRGVILWGSTQASAAGYASNVNISKGLACQPCFRENPAISRMPRGVCVNPLRAPAALGDRAREYGDGLHQCMADITTDEVVAAARQLWDESE